MAEGTSTRNLAHKDITRFEWSDFRALLLNRRWTLVLAATAVLVATFAWTRTPFDRPVDGDLSLGWLLIGGVAGLGAGLGLAVLLERRADLIRGEADVVGDPDLVGSDEVTLLGVVPEAARPSSADIGAGEGLAPVPDEGRLEFLSHYQPDSPLTSAYRSVRKSLLLLSAGSGHRVFLVTSPSPSEGKTTTSINMAISLAQTGTPTLLVSTDFRRPRTDEIFYARARGGLSGVLSGRVTLAQATVSTPVPDLALLPCGRMPKDPAELLLSDAFLDLIARLRADYGYVVVDSPPIASVPDALALARAVDVAVLVLRSGRSSRRLARRVLARFDSTGVACPKGVVLNGEKAAPAGAREGSGAGRVVVSDRA